MTVDVRDILIKAAEDVQSGMWCKGEFFKGASLLPFHVYKDDKRVDEALASKRCAMGSIAVATALLGGSDVEYQEAVDRANDLVRAEHAIGLVDFNDSVLPDDPFEAGQQLAELFRQAADE